MLQYQINNSSLKWSYMFDVLERNAEKLGISDYSLSQTSLEQVCRLLFQLTLYPTGEVLLYGRVQNVFFFGRDASPAFPMKTGARIRGVELGVFMAVGALNPLVIWSPEPPNSPFIIEQRF